MNNVVISSWVHTSRPVDSMTLSCSFCICMSVVQLTKLYNGTKALTDWVYDWVYGWKAQARNVNDIRLILIKSAYTCIWLTNMCLNEEDQWHCHDTFVSAIPFLVDYQSIQAVHQEHVWFNPGLMWLLRMARIIGNIGQKWTSCTWVTLRRYINSSLDWHVIWKDVLHTPVQALTRSRRTCFTC